MTLVNVTIAGVECSIVTISITQIQCQTGAYSFSSIHSMIQVSIVNNGFALNVWFN